MLLNKDIIIFCFVLFLPGDHFVVQWRDVFLQDQNTSKCNKKDFKLLSIWFIINIITPVSQDIPLPAWSLITVIYQLSTWVGLNNRYLSMGGLY